jgi:hypothetical protein
MNKYKDISVDVNIVLNVLFISVHHELDKRQGTRTRTPENPLKPPGLPHLY